MSENQKKGNLIAIVTMFALYGMVGFVTNLAAPLGDVWKAQPGINGSNTLGMMGNTMNFLAYLIMGIPAGRMIMKLGYKTTALIAIACGFGGIFVQWLSGEVLQGTSLAGVPANFFVYLAGAFICGFCVCMLNTVVNPMLNTVGGDIEAGLAIAELISGMKTPVVSLVLGGGHSIGVPLAVSAKRSFIVPSATMTVHPVRMNGLVLGVPQTLSYFDKMQERIVRFVTANSGISADRFRELMMDTGELVLDVGTVLDGESAVREGLIDELGGLSDALDYLYGLILDKNEKDVN